jgi:hypothetical protein
MEKSEYMVIRGERDFLYRYFKNCGGMDVGEQSFYVSLNAWLSSSMRQNPRIGQAKIVNFLDIKFGV